ncbi:MAG: right-handed parallel beta-helix repeat-containing protein [Alphaproteobacteria bacterium]|nr:right-handed parallel beta-helix repeat-containing protein [Alphaproteobacteria bacterium]
MTRLHPGVPCRLDLSKYRTEDPVLTAIETEGVNSGRLFNGTLHKVSSAKDLKALRGKLQPGDQVVLADGTWKDQDIVVEGNGTPEHPIIVRADHLGAVKLTGTSSAVFYGANLIVYGLAFVDGGIYRQEAAVFRLGDGPKKPCNGCIADRIAIDGYNTDPAQWDTIKNHWVVLQGRNITVANSAFTNKQNLGTMISPDLPLPSDECPQWADSQGDCFQHLLFINNTVSGFSKNHHHDPDNGEYKLIQLGWSGISTRSAYSVLEGNLFEYADGSNETLSIKASDVIIRKNRFHANIGTLNLRSSNRVLIENNVFDGDGQTSMGGVRIEAKDHWIVHNLFKNLIKPTGYDYWPIAIHTASEEELTDNYEDYARVKNVVIADNLFDHDEVPTIAVGIFPEPKQNRLLLPKNLYILDNTFHIAANDRRCAVPVFFEGGADKYENIVLKDNDPVCGSAH